MWLYTLNVGWKNTFSHLCVFELNIFVFDIWPSKSYNARRTIETDSQAQMDVLIEWYLTDQSNRQQIKRLNFSTEANLSLIDVLGYMTLRNVEITSRWRKQRGDHNVSLELRHLSVEASFHQQLDCLFKSIPRLASKKPPKCCIDSLLCALRSTGYRWISRRIPRKRDQ